MIDQKSIAVLPFENLSADIENEYFSDGMTDEIISALSKIEGLKVTARTSSFAFKGKGVDIRHIGNQLGVSTVLEGSIRRFNKRVRISTQLVRTDNGFHLWSERFDRHITDIFELQDEISLLIADKIRETFGHLEIKEQLVAPSTHNIEAYESYLKGQFHFKRKDIQDIKLALEYFQEAIHLDPEYSEAYASLGETYLHSAGFNLTSPEEGFTKSQEAVATALQVNPNEARAHKAIAFSALFFEWDWSKAISAYNKALKNGTPPENDFISYYYIFIQKDFDLAIKIAKDWTKKDPLHAITHWQLGICYYFAKDFKKAHEAFVASISLDEKFAESLRWKGLCNAFLGAFEQSYSDIKKSLELTQGEGLAHIDLLTLRILQGDEKDSLLVDIDQLETPDPCDKAQLYSLLNMPDKAIALLQQGMKARSTMMVTLKHYWIWDNIRESKGFKELMNAMNFGDQKTHKPHKETSELIPNNNFGLTEGYISQIQASLEKFTSVEDQITDHQLSLRNLAEQLNVHPNKLSWVLNEKQGYNFNEFINEKRLEIFKRKAIDPSNSHFSILGIAYESGFSSKSVFNEFFKKKVGLTPKAWLKQAK